MTTANMVLATSQTDILERTPTPDETFEKEVRAQKLLDVWAKEPRAVDRRLSVLMDRHHGIKMTVRDIRKLKRSQEFAELRAVATSEALWGVTHEIMERMPIITKGIMDLAEDARSERVRVDAFRELVNFLDKFVPRGVDDSGLGSGARNAAVVNIMFGAQQDDVIEGDIELLPPEDFDEGAEREKYFSLADEKV